MNWLAKLAAKEKSAEEMLNESLESYSRSDLQSLIQDLEPSYQPSGVFELQTKIARHANMGVELAREMNKEAMLPAIMAGARALAGPVLKTVAKDAVVGGVASKVTGALKPAGGQAAGAAGLGGGFKYAGIAGAGGLAGVGRQIAGHLHRHPGTAVTLGGAAAGAIMAPRDPQTGEKQMLRGAVMGGGLAAGANALSKGQIADKMKHMVTRQNNPVLGQGARRYMTESALATAPKGVQGLATRSAHLTGTPVGAPNQWQQAHAGVQEMRDKAMLAQTGPKGAPPVPVQQYMGGPTQGAVKVASLADYVKHQAMEKRANKGLLTYDPATKTFNKQTVKNTPPER